MVAGAPQMRIARYCRASPSTSALAGATRNAAHTRCALQQRSAPAPPPPRSSAPGSAPRRFRPRRPRRGPAPPDPMCPCAGSRRSSRREARMTAPIPTAPMGAACPICPTTPVSTAPRIGTVAFDSTMGSAIFSTRRVGDRRRGRRLSHRRARASGNAPSPARTAARDCPARPRHARWHSAAPTG